MSDLHDSLFLTPEKITKSWDRQGKFSTDTHDSYDNTSHSTKVIGSSPELKSNPTFIQITSLHSVLTPNPNLWRISVKERNTPSLIATFPAENS
jgi:hypothetical protein